MEKNKMVIFIDYAEVLLYNKFDIESGRIKIDIPDIYIVELHIWTYDTYHGASSIIDGKHIGIVRYITNAACNEWVFRRNGDRFDCRRRNLEIYKI